ncbi:MAG: glycerol-3-phosphate 1-O-acyltransferase PlsY [Candidatus Manganitrophus sp.]|nr:glycerol-3-phosphate 1-O-acyltransferase PlsY [Candidatus Manganitrophus sp.]WDT71912.1 MAG: glycerol-3-phosphate 1-O-acyltransferase PlsY [Candidatus Manganitrophus sp.]WDT80690.1 MAG: glycerol-3-phosphate 1-O-acyltransferase PlsY [Candidatus Manganitrophus sp.]
MLIEFGSVIIAYLVGSIPAGLLVSKFSGGIDPRQAGSKNIGATNVMRVAGKKAAALTLIGDLLKGLLPVAAARLFNLPEEGLLLVGLSAILGHIFPVYLKFKGGKGVATSFGVFLGIAPLIALIALLIWIAGISFSKYSSVGALSAFAALPFLAVLLKPEMKFVLFSTIISILVYIRHKENIQRLIAGREEQAHRNEG